MDLPISRRGELTGTDSFTRLWSISIKLVSR